MLEPVLKECGLDGAERDGSWIRPAEGGIQREGASGEGGVRGWTRVGGQGVDELPPWPRAQLERQVRVLDARYVQRTLPDPFAAERQWRSGLWWRSRLSGGRKGG